MRRPATRHLLALLAAAMIAAVVAVAAPAGADTKAELEAAQAEVAAIRAEADAANARYQTAYAEHSETVDAIAGQEAALVEAEQRLAVLEQRAADRAVAAYMGGTTRDPFGGDADTALDAGRREALLDNVAADDVDLVEELGVAREDAEDLRADLEGLRETQQAALQTMEAESAVIQDRLQDANSREAELEARYAAELAEQRRREEEERRRREAEAARQRAAEEAARRAATSTTAAPSSGGSSSGGSSESGGSSSGGSSSGGSSSGGSSSGGSSSGGGGGGSVPSGYACPVPGSSFIDSWGYARSGGRAHKGVDMMAPFGAVNYAVTGGTVRGTSSSLGGTSIYLYGDDGNTYYYAHLQRITATGRVERGTPIGETGNTGNASGGSPHTHFEVHLGGGGAVNPYPYARAWC